MTSLRSQGLAIALLSGMVAAASDRAVPIQPALASGAAPLAQAAPHGQPGQVPNSGSRAGATPPEVHKQPADKSAAAKAPAGSVSFQTSVSYEAAYDAILNVLKKEGYTLQSASKETGQITTELIIAHGAVDIGRAFVISLITESGGPVTVQVMAYKQGRRVGGQWQEKVYTKDKAKLLAEKLHAALGDNQ